MPDPASSNPFLPTGRLEKYELGEHPWWGFAKLTGLNHLLQAPVGVYLHCVQVVEPVDFGGVLPELLGEGVGQIVRWIGGLRSGRV